MFTALVGKYALPGLLALCAFLGVMLWVSGARLDAAQAERDRWKSQAQLFEEANEQLAQKVTSQNDAIKELEKAAKEREKKAGDLLKTADVQAIRHEAKVVQLTQVKVTTDECASMRAIIDAARM